MDPHATVDKAPGPLAPASDLGSGSDLLEDTKSLWHELRGLTHDHLQVAALETRRAGESLVTMITAGMMVAGLLLSVWLGLVGAAVLALIENGVMASSAMLLAVAVNLLVVLILYRVIRHQSHHLQLPTTVHSLQPAPPGFPDAERS